MSKPPRRHSYGHAWRRLPRWRRAILVALVITGLPAAVISVWSCIELLSNYPRRADDGFPQCQYKVHDATINIQWFPWNPTLQSEREDGWHLGFMGYYVGYMGTYVPPGYIQCCPIAYGARLPVWPIPLALLFLPVRWCWRIEVGIHRALERFRTAHCIECNYDLTGIADSPESVCPECGDFVQPLRSPDIPDWWIATHLTHLNERP